MATLSDYLEFTSDEIPVEKIFNLDGVDYKFLIRYNSYSDSYTCTIKDIDGNILITNRLTYLFPINDSVINGLNISREIVPVNFDNPDSEIPVNKANFNKLLIMLVDK